MKPTTTLRCRAAGNSSHIWAVQCDKPAKTERALGSAGLLPVCGVHANARYVYEYRPSGTSQREAPVQTELTRWR